MKRTTLGIKQFTTVLLVVLLMGTAPSTYVFAESTDTANTQSDSATKPETGTDKPTGAAAGTYNYNETSGLWENEYYTWNPNTKITVPKYDQDYTYNPATAMWDTAVWQYSASSGAYKSMPVSVTQPPAGAITHGGPVALPSNTSAESAGGSGASNASNTNGSNNGNAASPRSDSSASGSNNGANTINQKSTNNGQLNFTNSGLITNNLGSYAQSGNVNILGNTGAGNAQTGNASSISNIINMLQASSGFSGNNFTTFNKDINGNVQGDLFIDPTALMQPASIAAQNLTNLTVNDKNTGSINNTINLAAQSGNASAIGNTEVGDITSGNANAVADVVNMIDSVVAANQSFLGVVNIYGDYTGNIVLPTDTLNALLSSGGTGSLNSLNNATDVNSTVNATSNQTINNNTNFNANSGDVTADKNTQTGSATSGDSLTNLTLLNLTGRKVVGADSLLVFVNVLGSWVGLIMDAPTGATSAAYGGGITENTTNAANLTGNFTNNQTINNNINLAAASGSVTASKNTKTGNLKSGNATTSANIANISGSQLDLSNWFGILFINVFGSWHGNFGSLPTAAKTTSSATASSATPAIKDMRVFKFVPTGSTTTPTRLAPVKGNQAQSDGDTVQKVNDVLAASIEKSVADQAHKNKSAATDSQSSLLSLPFIFGLAGLTAVGTERIRSVRKTTLKRSSK